MPDDRAPSGRRFRAFISYSREDRALAIALEIGLQRLAKPRGAKRIFEVFLDLDDIPGGKSLPEHLRNGLADSDFLVVVASPAAAESHWVNEELATWFELGRTVDEIIIVLSDGDLVWDTEPKSGAAPGWAAGGDLVLPEPLRGTRFTEPPTWVDFRDHTAVARADPEDAGVRLSLQDPAFKVSVARVQAPLRGEGWTPSDIVGEDLDLWRAARRRRRRAITALAVLTVTATIAGIVAIAYQRRSAAQERTALSRQLAVQSSSPAGTSLDLGLLLAVEAFRVDETAEAFGGLIGAATRAGEVARVLRGHDRALRGIAFSPGGELMATTAVGGSVVLWDTRTWEPVDPPLRGVSADDPGLRDLTFVGDRLVAGDFEGRLHVWDVSDPGSAREDVIEVQAHGGRSITQIAATTDGRLVTAGGLSARGTCVDDTVGSVALVDLVARVERPIVDVPTCVGSLAVAPDGRTIAVGRIDGFIELVDAETGGPRTGAWLAHWSPTRPDRGMVVSALAFQATGDRLVSGGWDRRARVWDLEPTPTMTVEYSGHGDVVRSLELLVDGSGVVSADRTGTVAIWSSTTGEPLRILRARHSGEVWQVAAHPGGRWLASASTDETVAVWDLERRGGVSDLLHGGAVDAVVVDEGRGIVVAAGAEIITDVSGERRPGLAWTRLDDRVPNPVVLDRSPTALARDPTSGAIVVGHDDGVVAFWDPEDWELTRVITPSDLAWCVGDEPGSVVDVATGSDGRLAIAFGTRVVVLLDAPLDDPQAGRCVSTTGPPFAVEFSPDGSIAASSNGDGRVTLVGPGADDTRTVVGTSEVVTSLAFDSEGRVLAVGGSDGDVTLLDVGSGDRIGSPLEGHIARVRGLAFRPDGEILASVSDDRAVMLWNVRTGLPISAPLADHGRAVHDVEWFDDGRALATAGGNVLLWDLEPSHLVGSICRAANRDLTREEWGAFMDRRSYDATCPTVDYDPVDEGDDDA